MIEHLNGVDFYASSKEFGQDSVGRYFDEIAKFPLLKGQEETVLGFSIMMGRFALLALDASKDSDFLTLHQKQHIQALVEKHKERYLLEKLRQDLMDGSHALFSDKGKKARGIPPYEELATKYMEQFVQGLIYARENLVLDKVSAGRIIDEMIYQESDLVRSGSNSIEALVNHNLRFVVNRAKRYRELTDSKMLLMDLIQNGNLGLIKAAVKFDPRLGYRFSTYSSRWINQVLSKEVTFQKELIRLPFYVNVVLTKMRQIEEDLSQKWGRKPTFDELLEVTSTKCQVGKNTIMNALGSFQVLSLDFSVGEEGHTVFSDLMSLETQQDSIETHSEQMDRKRQVGNLLQILTPREKFVLEHRFGIGGEPSKTLEEIGDALQVTRERIRQIEVGALRKLRDYCRVNGT